jgi:hypothetical protein
MGALRAKETFAQALPDAFSLGIQGGVAAKAFQR